MKIKFLSNFPNFGQKLALILAFAVAVFTVGTVLAKVSLLSDMSEAIENVLDQTVITPTPQTNQLDQELSEPSTPTPDTASVSATPTTNDPSTTPTPTGKKIIQQTREFEDRDDDDNDDD